MHMRDLGPFQVVLNWQTLLLALCIGTLTHFVKRVVDTALGGTEKRKTHKWINRVFLPAVPLAFGLAGGICLPIQPDVLVQYATDKVLNTRKALLLYGVWGVVIGQFADYAYQKFKDLINTFDVAAVLKALMKRKIPDTSHDSSYSSAPDEANKENK